MSGQYTPVADTGKSVSKKTIFQTNSANLLNRLCFMFRSFQVAGSSNCAKAGLNITGTENSINSGLFCDSNPPPLNTLICVDANRKLTFDWLSDGTTNGAGWVCHILYATPAPLVLWGKQRYAAALAALCRYTT